jgi:hypothetical protein
MATGSAPELTIGTGLPDAGNLSVVAGTSLDATHRLVFAPEAAPGLRAQFADAQFAPQAPVRD